MLKNSFPYGKCTKLVSDELNVVLVDAKMVVFKSTQKPISGLVKATIIQNQNVEPFLPIRIKREDKNCPPHLKKIKTEEVLITKCYTCAYEKMQSSCHHCPKNRQITITATIASLNYAMKNDYCTLVEIHEIWVSKFNVSKISNLLFLTYILLF